MREIRGLAVLAAILGGVLLGGCDTELVMVTDVDDYPLSTKSLRSFLAQNGGLGLVVINGPSSPTKAEADKAIASALKVPGRSDISVTPIADSSTAYRIVLVYDPPNSGTVNVHRICSGNIGALDRNREVGATRIFGSLCAADRIVSHATVLSAPLAPGDKGFRDVANAMMIGLFPPIPRGDRSDCAFC